MYMHMISIKEKKGVKIEVKAVYISCDIGESEVQENYENISKYAQIY